MKSLSIFLLLLNATVVVKAQNAPSTAGPGSLVVAEPVAISREAQVALRGRFAAYQAVRLDFRTLSASLRRGLTTHRLSIEGVLDQELTMEVRDFRASNYRLFTMDADGLHEQQQKYVPNTYLLRDANLVEVGRLNVDDDTFEARIQTGEDIVYIRKLSRFVETTDRDVLVVNRLRDDTSGADDICDVNDVNEDPRLQIQQPAAPAGGGGGGNGDYETCVQIEIAGAGDHTLFQQYGVYGTESRVFEVINMAEHIFMSDFGLPFTITGNVVSVTDDPYDSTDSKKLLASFKEHWNDLEVPIKRDIAMLVSGKNFDGGTKGRAYIGVAGLPSRAYGIAQSDTDKLDYMVAHEIGHSLDAEHDNSGCAHLFSKNRWIMCPWVGSKAWSGTSRNAIIDYVNANIGLFLSEYTVTTNPYFADGQLTQGELHAAGEIIAEDYLLNLPSHDVTLISRTKITLRPTTRVINGAKLRCLIDPNLHCTDF